MNIILNRANKTAYNYLQTAWLGESPTCNLSHAARRVLDPSIYRYSLVGRAGMALLGLTMNIPLVKKASDFATSYLIKHSFIQNPEFEPTAPPRIDREYRQISDESVVAEKLTQERLAAVSEGESQVKRLSKFARIANGSLNHPLDPKRPGIQKGGHNDETTLSHNGLPINVNTAYMQGDRPSMEDEHIAQVFQIRQGHQTHTLSLFSVFDGHNGPDASAFVKQNIVHTLQYYLEREPLSDTAIFNALKLTFVDLDQRFIGTSGTCASVALILDGNLWVAIPVILELFSITTDEQNNCLAMQNQKKSLFWNV